MLIPAVFERTRVHLRRFRMKAATLLGLIVLGSMASCTLVPSPERGLPESAPEGRGIEVTSAAPHPQKRLTKQSLVAESLALEAESAARLAVEGQWLFKADSTPLTGYQYCSAAVRLIEEGDLRLGIREASKALFLGQQSRDETLQGYAYHDLAYAYSLAGDLERAQQFADEAIKHILVGGGEAIGEGAWVIV